MHEGEHVTFILNLAVTVPRTLDAKADSLRIRERCYCTFVNALLVQEKVEKCRRFRKGLCQCMFNVYDRPVLYRVTLPVSRACHYQAATIRPHRSATCVPDINTADKMARYAR